MIARNHFQARLAVLAAVFASAAVLAAAPASAANYTFTGNVPVTLSGSGITVSILSGSKADSFTIGSSTILVTVLSGDTFTLRYAGPDPGTLANNGGISDCALNGSDNEATVTGPATVTFTPSTTVCGGSGGGGGAGGAAAAAENNKPLAVTVASPNGGESVQAGSSRTIFWNKEGGEFHYVTIQLSTNGGNSYPTTLASQIPDNGAYSWSVAADTLSTTQAKIRVQFIVLGEVKTSDFSDGNFSIVGASAAPASAPGNTSPGTPEPTGPVPVPGPSLVPGTTPTANGTTPAGTDGQPAGQPAGEPGAAGTSVAPGPEEDVGVQPPAAPLTSLPKLGEAGPAVEALKAFLTANGFPAGDGAAFDGAAQAALIQFQIEHSESGALGPNTLRFINDLLRRKSPECRRSFFNLVPPIRAIGRTLVPDDVDGDVRVLQKFLNDNGFVLGSRGAGAPGSESDYFGARTRVALARFQAAYGLLSEKGGLGPKNLFFLEGLSADPPRYECPTLIPPTSPLGRTLRRGSRGADVRVLQKFLNDNNYLLATQGPGSRGLETATFSTLTASALLRFQNAYGYSTENGALLAGTRAFVNSLPRP